LQFFVPQPSELLAFRADGSAVVAAPQFSGNLVFTSTELLEVTFASSGRVEAICDSADYAEIVSVVPGQLLTLFGTNLAPPSSTPSGFPNSFDGVTVTFNGIDAPILFASGDQINLQVPYEVAGQTQVTMQVSSKSVSPAVSEPYFLAVVARQPSVFVSPASFADPLIDLTTCNGQSLSGVEALTFNADGRLNMCANPAAAGSTITIVLNAIGATIPAQSTGSVSSSAVPITPAASIVPPSLSTLPTALPTRTLPGLIAGVAQVQIPAPAKSSVVYLEVIDSSGSRYVVRGPGIVIWVAEPQ
jgi:uncharacterized protein (TIGR03437 family)